jgi:myo-inositol-1(or 4)-monophosphatase
VFERERRVAEEAARAAGAVIRGLYERPLDVREKGHDNPVTEADLRANECIRGMLRQAFPQDGWLSEETADSRERLERPRVWIVDPLDGTKEFIQHIPELCVCIALVEEGVPIVGVELNPIRNELFSAARGGGLQLNGAPACVSDVADLARACVLASRSEDKRGERDPFKPLLRVELTGSVAYKLALIAAGRADATFSLTPKNEWDVCAGAMLIQEGGGVITDSAGQPLRFNQPNTKLPGLIASNRALFAPLRTLPLRTLLRRTQRSATPSG